MKVIVFFVALLSYCIDLTYGNSEQLVRDAVVNLTGLIFDPGFKQYSGFLHTTSGNNLHYWLVESQNNPETDPVVLWLNGGPGCSSLGGFFTENGPFRVNQDGKTLFEFVYSWNKGANVFYLESPYGVGFSYRDEKAPPDNNWNDVKTANDNADAVVAFFERFPKFRGRPFFITGESYAGIYIPTLANTLIQRILAGTVYGVNLAGVAIGNGYLSVNDQTNSVIDLFYWRGMLGMDEYNSLQECCKSISPSQPLAYCNFSNFIDWETGGPKNFGADDILNECANKIATFAGGNELNDAYNSYQDCYMDSISPMSAKVLKLARLRSQKVDEAAILKKMVPSDFIDQGARINIDSTDAQYGFPCWADETMTNYLNLPEVRNDLHIPPNVQQWQQCANLNYEQQFLDMSPVFKSILETGYPLQIMIYNGDVDTVCNFLGDEWFVTRLAKNMKMTAAPRYSWTFREKEIYFEQLAGYRKNYTYGQTSLEFVTVKGAGHFVPMDRPGPSLQMLTNFMEQTNFNSSIRWNCNPKPIYPKYRPLPPPSLTRKDADRVWYLPGLTYTPNFRQYSGYLHGVKGNYLHYWLVESQNKPLLDPLVLWLNGGPGCSSIGGFFSENGPFFPNPDGKTLFENIYSWNKLANVLYIEAPRNVGFSYQNTSINPDPSYNDLKTARDTFLALMDFLTVFPEYTFRPFYITGESYAGIYIPTLTAYTIDEILANNAPGLNLKGIAIGNGELSKIEQLNSIMSMLFYRGIYGYDTYKQLMECCPNIKGPVAYCDFSKLVTFDGGFGNPNNESNTCDNLIAQFGSYYIWENSNIQDVYNLYEDGYRQRNQPSFEKMKYSSKNLKLFSKLLPEIYGVSLYADRRSKLNYDSTDGKGNFYWYQQEQAPNYLNLQDVRTALHIPTFLPPWSDCNDNINENYNQQHDDTTPVFQHIINSKYPLQILIYNGDADTACQFLGDEWFTEKLAAIYQMPVKQVRIPWLYQSQRAGYWKQFISPTGTVDLVTVKGAGHFVPLDRPGPALQMINNFLSRSAYTTPLPFDVAPLPLKKEYQLLEQIDDAKINASENTRSKRFAHQKTLKVEEEVKIANELPGMTFDSNFETNHGYLHYSSTGKDSKLFYWLITAVNKSSAPLILWLGDGPGCSSIYDIFNTIGPYRLSSDGKLIFQNPFSWNQAANLLFLEASPGCGFSSSQAHNYTDDEVVDILVKAVQFFYLDHPLLKKVDLYIFGKGYGSIYAVLLSSRLLSEANSINLRGIGLANGLLDYNMIVDTLPNEMYFSALLGKSEWDQLEPCCTNPNGVYDNYCKYSNYIKINPFTGAVEPKQFDDETNKKCAELVVKFAYQAMLDRKSPSGNMYRSCYEGTIPEDPPSKRIKREAGHLDGLPLTNLKGFINQQNKINYRSTDAFASYPCYMDYAITQYLNRPSVVKMLFPDDAIPPTWQKCNPSYNYERQYFNLTKQILALIKTQRIRILVYDGDSHLQNNFLANELVFDMLAANKDIFATSGRNAWTYQFSSDYLPQYAGFLKSYRDGAYPAYKLVDVITIKGAGYYIAQDRPQAALQMISNFLSSTYYNRTVAVLPQLPLRPMYSPEKTKPVSRREADRIYSLPGLTYMINFRQYAGYLKPSTGNYLHYWFVESQGVPATDPVIIWFTGGPGCSSLTGLLLENGPFRPNPDGVTLFENVFSWNKLANVLYIESPRMVGFSYQDMNASKANVYDDTNTANDAYAAIVDFFTVYEDYQKNDLYISGESYGGIYVPTLTALMITKIQAGEKTLNLKGIAIGNGYLSTIQDIRSLPSYMYFHGIYGEETWNQLQTCCKANGIQSIVQSECAYDSYVRVDSSGALVPLDNSDSKAGRCGRMIANLAYDRIWSSMNYVYNIYQDCYHQTTPIIDFSPEKHPLKVINEFVRNEGQKLRTNMGIAYMKAMPWSINNISTDALGGFPCYSMRATMAYLNQPHIRSALHVPNFVQPFSICSDMVSNNYHKQYNDTTQFFQTMFDSNYPLRVLIYNGDVDTACGIFEAEWFIEDFAKKNQMPYTPHGPWLYQLSPHFEPQIGGYYKRFESNNLTIDLVTVKGAGHMVPMDRAGPMLQLLTNFVRKLNYNDASPFSFERCPLLPEYLIDKNERPIPLKN